MAMQARKVKKVLLVGKDTCLKTINSTDDQNAKKLLQQGHVIVSNVKAANDQHYNSLDQVKQMLTEMGIEYQVVGMEEKGVSLDGVDLVIPVGGDGTFMYAANFYGGKVPLFGINSDFPRSLGHFCIANTTNMRSYLDSIIQGELQPVGLVRLEVRIDGKLVPDTALNEVAFGNRFFAGVSRYMLNIGDVTERQRGGGVIICTPSGSTGWMDSERGTTQAIGAHAFQYAVNSLIISRDTNNERQKVKLYRGILGPKEQVKIISGTKGGVVAIDGEYIVYPLDLGQELIVCASDTLLPCFVHLNAHDWYAAHPYSEGLPAKFKPRATLRKRLAGLASRLIPSFFKS